MGKFFHTHIHQKKLFCSKAWFKRSAKLGLSSFFLDCFSITSLFLSILFLYKYLIVTIMLYISRSSVAAPRGYFNQMATLRPSPASTGGQLSDPDSGFFSSSNETWLGSDPQSATSTAMLIDSASSPLSSSSSMLSHPQQNNSQNTNQIIPNNKLLAHTLENRKRVLHSLMREKTDTLV